jgi:large subunit ribosomal protein L21
MYAIVEQGGKQYWVTPGETLRVDRIEAKAGEKIELKALWAGEEKESGKGSSSKAKVTAEILRQVRGPKLFILRKKPKSTYSRQRGHRQDLTEIRIKDISLN